MMNWDAIGAVGELIGAVAVIFSLIYVARQVRDGSNQIRLNTTSNMMALTQDSFSVIYNSQANQDIWHTGVHSPNDLTESQHRQFIMYMDRVFYAHQLCVTHYDAGVIEEDVFQMQNGYLKGLSQTPGGRKWLTETTQNLSDKTLYYLGVGDNTSPSAQQAG